MRLVLDSDVLIAALATRGGCSELFEYVLANHDFAIDDNVLGEVERILRDKLRVPADRIHGHGRLLRRHGTQIDPPALPEPVCRDPDDDRILALCGAFGAEVLVSGAGDLLVLDPWEGVRILALRDFWAFEAAAHRSSGQ